MQALRNLVAVWVHGLVTSRHMRLWTSLVAWVVQLIVLLGRGLPGLFSNGLSNPYSQAAAEYSKVTFSPTAPVYVPGDPTIIHYSLSVVFWHWMWGLWLLMTVAIFIQLLVEFGEEVGRGWQRIIEREGIDETGSVSTPSSSGSPRPSGSPPSRGPRITAANILELDVAAEFLGEALFRLYRRATGGAKA